MSGIMMATTASYIKAGSMLFGTTASNILVTVPALTSSAGTYEFFFYTTAGPAGTFAVPFNTRSPTNNSSGGLLIEIDTSPNHYGIVGNNTLLNPAGNVILNAWNHLAITLPSGQSGSVGTFWLNGVSQGTFTLDVNQIGTNICLGGRVYPGLANSYISSFRYVRGVQVYTGTFTPPRDPLTDTQSAGTNISAITAGQTQLLLNTKNDSNYLTDSSSYARTVTTTGTVSYSSLNPF